MKILKKNQNKLKDVHSVGVPWRQKWWGGPPPHGVRNSIAVAGVTADLDTPVNGHLSVTRMNTYIFDFFLTFYVSYT